MRKSLHRLNHFRLATGDLGELIPVGCVEVLPGDVFRHGANVFIRVSPLAAPVLHPVEVRLHHFYVPHRIVWSDAGGTGTWEDFVTGGNAGTDTQTVPQVNTTGNIGDLLDYLGIPPTSGLTVSALPLAGVNRIFNEWYRDQDLVTARDPDDVTIPSIAWAKDYFTASRPWPQRGEAVGLPIGDSAPVVAVGGMTVPDNSIATLSADSNGLLYAKDNAVAANAMTVDLAAATGVNVADVRLAFMLQRFKEVMAEFGARYPEYLNRWGVRDLDGRLQIPELLAGGSANIAFSEVMQTAPDTTERAFSVGDLYGHGVAALRSAKYTRKFPEWGYVHSFLSVRPYAMYMDGIPRTFLRQDKEDFYTPELENVGDQAVYKNEVYADAVDGDDVWSYQGRYDDYRTQPSQVTGEFRDTLDYWHLGRTFASDPALNGTFVTCTPSKRVFNEQTMHSLWIRVQHRISAIRRVSRRATTRML